MFALLLKCIYSGIDIDTENDPYAGLSDAVKAQLKKQEEARQAMTDFINKNREKLGFQQDDILPLQLSDEQVKKLDGTFNHSGSKKYYELARALEDANEAVLNGPEAAQAKASSMSIWTIVMVGMIAHFVALYFVR